MTLPILQDRCTGHCCRKFYLPFGPEELAEAAAHVVRRRNAVAVGEKPPAFDANGHNYHDDVLQVHDMVEYLGWIEAAPEIDTGEPGRMGHHYRCKNLLDNGDCGIYETRPHMCKDYPNYGTCRYVECTWAAAKEKEKEKEDGTLKA